MPFLDRRAAGRRLAERLRFFRNSDVVVLGVPAGGVQVAYEVAAALSVPLDLAVVRRMTVPYQPWSVFGALGEDGVCVLDEDVVARALVSELERFAVQREQRERLARSVTRYRGDLARRWLDGRTAVVVDDGIGTAVVVRAAVAIARDRGAGRVVVAAPVGAGKAVSAVSEFADHVVCLETPPLFGSVQSWYRDYDDVSEADVCALLHRAPTAATVARDPQTRADSRPPRIADSLSTRPSESVESVDV
ncbi:phosphoribosyltransferase [Nocardia brasiliensis]|uniref:phosphoribosyltransferase n=1 Tax=Nocardia brasiliensis TaxID=37326 RepID=UPI00366C1D2B